MSSDTKAEIMAEIISEYFGVECADNDKLRRAYDSVIITNEASSYRPSARDAIVEPPKRDPVIQESGRDYAPEVRDIPGYCFVGTVKWYGTGYSVFYTNTYVLG